MVIFVESLWLIWFLLVVGGSWWCWGLLDWTRFSRWSFNFFIFGCAVDHLRKFVSEPHVHWTSIFFVFFLFSFSCIDLGRVFRSNLSITHTRQLFKSDHTLVLTFLWSIWQRLHNNSWWVKATGNVDYVMVELKFTLRKRALDETSLAIS